MMPTYFRGPLSAAQPGASLGGSAAGGSAVSISRDIVIGPILAHVLPLSVLRSTHAAQVSCASTEDPLTIVPSSSTSGFARMGPSNPAGSRSSFDHVLPSSSLNMRPAAHSPGDGPTLK